MLGAGTDEVDIDADDYDAAMTNVAETSADTRGSKMVFIKMRGLLKAISAIRYRLDFITFTFRCRPCLHLQ